jgi:hypothetical protein
LIEHFWTKNASFKRWKQSFEILKILYSQRKLRILTGYILWHVVFWVTWVYKNILSLFKIEKRLIWYIYYLFTSKPYLFKWSYGFLPKIKLPNSCVSTITNTIRLTITYSQISFVIVRIWHWTRYEMFCSWAHLLSLIINNFKFYYKT